MTRALLALCGRLGVPLGFVLEGGYDLAALSESVAATLAVLIDRAPAAGRPNERPSHPAAIEAARRLAPRWPSVRAA